MEESNLDALAVPLIQVHEAEDNDDEAHASAWLSWLPHRQTPHDGVDGAPLQVFPESIAGWDAVPELHKRRPRSLSIRSGGSIRSRATTEKEDHGDDHGDVNGSDDINKDEAKNFADPYPEVSTIVGSAFTFTNFIIQPGNPANLPIACQQSGLALFPVLVVVFGIVNCFTCDLLAEAIAVVGHTRAVGMAELLSNRFGRTGWYAGALSVILANFGSLVYTVLLIGQMITPLVGLSTSNPVLCSNWLWNVITAVFFLAPLAFIKNMGALDDASKFAVVFVITLVLCLFGYGIYLSAEPSDRDVFGGPSFLDECTNNNIKFSPPGNDYRVGPPGLVFFSALGNLAFSFNAQANVFPLYLELKQRSPARMKVVNKYAMVLSGVIFIVSGIFGYIAFLDSTENNCVYNFPVKGGFGYFMDVVRILLAISLVTSYPLTLWECRSHLEQMIANDSDSDLIVERKRLGMSFFLIFISTVIAIVAKDVGIIFGFFGATACPFLMFILPCLNHLKIHRHNVPQSTLPVLGMCNWNDWKDFCAMGVLIFATIMIPLSLYSWAAFQL